MIIKPLFCKQAKSPPHPSNEADSQEHIFYRFVTARCYASAVLAMALCPSVCPFVRLSVISRSSTKTAKCRITHTTPHDSPGTLVFWNQRSPRNLTGVTPYGAPNAGGVGQNRRLSTKSAISKTVQDRRILLKSNKKSYAIYWMVKLLMTLSDP